ncbi:hypothetical protein AB1K42_29170 [Roseibium algicola]|uniref:hypothetical protein n=1 Tax=Roseibium TaxID=150830 RepID=UPI001E3721C3|nr:hypothetical protein [Roseibium aggregatum]UES49804.1 hypothetical protein GFK88_09345 [Roseibium aggregatum]
MMKTTSLALAAVMSTFLIQATPASAGQSCWGLEGQALQDCIDNLVDELGKIGHESNSDTQTVKIKKSSRQKSR